MSKRTSSNEQGWRWRNEYENTISVYIKANTPRMRHTVMRQKNYTENLLGLVNCPLLFYFPHELQRGSFAHSCA